VVEFEHDPELHPELGLVEVRRSEQQRGGATAAIGPYRKALHVGGGRRRRRAQWKATTNGPELDGFEIKRAGDEPVNARIILQLKWSPPRFKLSRALAEVLGLHTETQAAVLMALYKYIKVLLAARPVAAFPRSPR